MNTEAQKRHAGILTRILAIAAAVIVAALIYAYRPEENSPNAAGGWIFLLTWGAATTALIKTTATLSLGMHASGLERSIFPKLQVLAYGIIVGLLAASMATDNAFGIGIEPTMLCWPVLIFIGIPVLAGFHRRESHPVHNQPQASQVAHPPA